MKNRHEQGTKENKQAKGKNNKKQKPGVDKAIKQMKNERCIKIGTWNIRSITGKENELIEEFAKAKLEILAITETKKKGKGEIKIKGHEII